MSKEQAGMIMPILYVESVEPLREFYVDKLGFGHMMGMLGGDGQLDFCTVIKGAARIMINRPPENMEGIAPAASRPIVNYLEVDNVDAYHEEVKSRGVKVTEPLTDQWWGDRTFTVVDPYGYTLWFFQSVGELVPPPGAKIV